MNCVPQDSCVIALGPTVQFSELGPLGGHESSVKYEGEGLLMGLIPLEAETAEGSSLPLSVSLT